MADAAAAPAGPEQSPPHEPVQLEFEFFLSNKG